MRLIHPVGLSIMEIVTFPSQMPDAEKCDNVSMVFVLKCHLLRP